MNRHERSDRRHPNRQPQQIRGAGQMQPESPSSGSRTAGIVVLALLAAALAGCAADQNQDRAAHDPQEPDPAVPSEPGPAGLGGPRPADPASPADPAAPQRAHPPVLTLDAPKPTLADRLVVTGTLSEPALLHLRAADGEATYFSNDVQAGETWSAELAGIPFGHSVLTAWTDDGASASATLVRLAPLTLEFKFTAYPLHADWSDAVGLDLEGFASEPAYEDTDVEHPGHATVHDLMATWQRETGVKLEYGYFDGAGYALDKVDGVGSPLTAAAPPYWCYKLNGESAGLGLSLQEVGPGDIITWEYGACA